MRRRLGVRAVCGLVGAALAVGAGLAVAPQLVAPSPASAQLRLMIPSDTSPREWAVSRDFRRLPLEAGLPTKGNRYLKKAVTARRAPEAKSEAAGKLKFAAKVRITGVTSDGWRMVMRGDEGVWVPNRLLVTKKPVRIAALSTAPCATGSAMESGLTADAIAVHRALCARYPQVTSYGGMRADYNSYHSSGRAVDAMISDLEVGWDMARWLQVNARRLGISEIIFAQRIWTVQRADQGWRPMGSRGSVSANHYDHVHISVHGSSGTG